MQMLFPTMKFFQALSIGAASVLAYNIWKASFALQAESQPQDCSKSLCFKEASIAWLMSEISEKEYFGHLLVHLQGIRHPSDTLTNRGASSRIPSDRFASSLREVALSGDYEPQKGTPTSMSAFHVVLTRLRYNYLLAAIGELFSWRHS